MWSVKGWWCESQVKILNNCVINGIKTIAVLCLGGKSTSHTSSPTVKQRGDRTKGGALAKGAW